MNGLGAKHLRNERWNVGWKGERFRCNTTRYYKIKRKLDNLIEYKYLDSVFFVFFEIFSFEEKNILYITPLQIQTHTCIHASNTFKHHLFLKYPTELSIYVPCFLELRKTIVSTFLLLSQNVTTNSL